MTLQQTMRIEIPAGTLIYQTDHDAASPTTASRSFFVEITHVTGTLLQRVYFKIGAHRFYFIHERTAAYAAVFLRR